MTTTNLRAAAATADITPTGPVLMDGYGARREPSRGVHDPLFARTLLLEDGDSRCAIVSCDLLGMHSSITNEVRHLASERLGIPPDGVLLCATHNHAGPAGLRGGMFSTLDESLAGMLVQRIYSAIEEATRALRPATLKLGQATIETISMNRRHPDWPIDPVLRVLLVDGEDAPIASVLGFACHATVLSGENLMLSAEFPGAACRLLQEQTGAPALYLQGACGNVNPVWTKQDFDSVQRAGHILGGHALRIVSELRALGPGQRAHNIRWDEFPEKPTPGRIASPSLRAARREIDLPLRSFLPDEDYAARIQELESKAASLAAGSNQRREVIAQLTRFQNERWAAAWARRQPDGSARTDRASALSAAPRFQTTELQALQLGEDLALLALPGEFFVETANEIREQWRRQAGGLAARPEWAGQSRGGHEGVSPNSSPGVGQSSDGDGRPAPDLLLACYANDYIGYVIPRDAYDQGGYEAGITFCTPDVEEIIVEASLNVLAEARGTSAIR